MLLLTGKRKEATFAVISLPADTQLRERDMGGIYTLSPTLSPQKPRQETIKKNSFEKIKKCGEDTEVYIYISLYS